jgi:hypothetical protein
LNTGGESTISPEARPAVAAFKAPARTAAEQVLLS